MGDVGATLQFLEGQPCVEMRKVAITGFCWGGRVTWTPARPIPSFKAGVAWYGQHGAAAGRAGRSRAGSGRSTMSASLHCAGAGPLRRQGPAGAGQSRRCAQALAAAGKTDSEIIVYPDAGHGFHADYRASYNAADAEDGWTRLLAFFAANGVAPRPFRAG